MSKDREIKLEIRKIHEMELALLAKEEECCFPDLWSEKSLKETFSQDHAWILTGWWEGRLAGYVIFYYVLDEGEIARIAVNPTFRRIGVASSLMEELKRKCLENGINKIMLDVRESNIAAISFYEKCGFMKDGIRKHFYTNPDESAVLMSKELGN